MSTKKNYRFPWRKGNRFECLVDSTEFFPRMLGAIDAAQQYVFLEMYLVASGTVADRFIHSLLAAAERGVPVYLLLDDFGSQQLNKADHKQLAHRNIHVVFYNPLTTFNTAYNLYRIVWRRSNRGLYRNHRKLLLVDGSLAYAGGAGITDEVDSPLAPEKRWRETMVQIQGPVLRDWQQLFTESWNKYAEKRLTVADAAPDTFTPGQHGRVTVNEPHHRMGIQRSLLKHLKGARQRVWLATAYFIPSWSIRRKLKHAARNGVDVRLLLPGPATDHPGVRYASRRYYSRLLKSGIRIYEYTPRFFHAKTALCDDWVSIGSCNYDRWNLQWNLEANQGIDDKDMAATVADIFKKDFSNSREYTYKEWKQRGWWLRTLEWFWRRVELLSITIKHRRRR